MAIVLRRMPNGMSDSPITTMGRLAQVGQELSVSVATEFPVSGRWTGDRRLGDSKPPPG